MRSRLVWAFLVTSGLFTTAAAQAPESQAPSVDRLFVVEQFAPVPAFGARIDIVGSEGGVPGPVVKGKPYSARSITESTQVLADGNRITQRNEAVIHRDSEGRSRREQTLRGLGPWPTSSPTTVINIYDPVAGKSFTLDPGAKTARETRPFEMALAPLQVSTGAMSAELGAAAPATAVPVPAPVPGAVDTSVTVVQRAEAGVEVFGTMRGGVAVAPPFREGATGAYQPAEDLGEQVLEGLLVRGTRLIDTIPAGAIGNDRAIEIVTERWYSEDIDALVFYRFSDPRFGETTYRLVNVVRSDPPRDLFEVPQDYELQSVPSPGIAWRGLPAMPGQPVELTLQREPSEQ